MALKAKAKHNTCHLKWHLQRCSITYFAFLAWDSTAPSLSGPSYSKFGARNKQLTPGWRKQN